MRRWLRTPMRWLRGLLVNRDLGDPLWDGGRVPAYLAGFQEGEALPWKGVVFRVGKIVGGDTPAIILVPVGLTHGGKLRTLRAARDLMRQARDAPRERRDVRQ